MIQEQVVTGTNSLRVFFEEDFRSHQIERREPFWEGTLGADARAHSEEHVRWTNPGAQIHEAPGVWRGHPSSLNEIVFRRWIGGDQPELLLRSNLDDTIANNGNDMKRVAESLAPHPKARIDDHRVVGSQALHDVGKSFPDPSFAALYLADGVTQGIGKQVASEFVF
ncbi:hypothetical protein [Cystobacter fuscus]|uniref:hypothetical protein n=1 Tax=Cystobacter fuscus TaxID=43 RepID=UPI0012DDE23B|nr:hypothetical protein [Cystobacter fuscus]